MSIRFDATTDYIRSTAGALAFTGSWTFMAWVYLTSNGGSGHYSTVWSCNQNSSSHYDGIYFYYNGTNINMLIASDNGTYSETSGGTNLSTGTWYHFALVRSSSSSIVGYLNGVSNLTGPTQVQTGSSTQMDAGTHPSFTTDNFDGRIDAIKIFDAALTATQIDTERRYRTPRLVSSVNRWTPCLAGSSERLMDYSGQGRNWTAGGTLTDEAQANLNWGAPVLTAPFVAAAGASGNPYYAYAQQ